jgi:hypothetical protein
METTILIVTRPDGACQRVAPPVKLQKRFSGDAKPVFPYLTGRGDVNAKIP